MTPSTAGSESFELVSPARRRAIIEGKLDKLPLGASTEERVEAIQQARKLVQELGPEATELDILQAATDAVLSVAGSCEHRLRRERILSRLWTYLPFDSSEDEKGEAEETVCALLEHLPLMPASDLEERIRRKLTALVKRIERRARLEKLMAHGQGHIDRVLTDLYLSKHISSKDRWDRSLREDLESAAAEALQEELDGSETRQEVEEIVASVVEDELDL